MLIQNRLAFWLSLFACALALTVVLLGAYTRLKDAGLGCPDWPGCYGQVVVPSTAQGILHAEQAFPGQAVSANKAWPEMIHRYVAGTLGLLVFAVAFLVILKRKLPHQPVGLAVTMIALVIFQALLGKWTVTLKLLPTVVMLHLLGGMTLLALLWLMVKRLGGFFNRTDYQHLARFKPWAAIGFAIIFLQILLGGWTSSNYAALICPDFPFCQGKLWPVLNFHSAFNFWVAVGPNFQGGLLDNTSRVTIHMMHRVGALITFFYVGGLALWVIVASNSALLKKIAGFILAILMLQVLLGIANILWLLPLPIAVAHNGVAALLLLSMLSLNYVLNTTTKNYQFAR